ncbi:MAG TPA: PTS sugar transporter subunit IIC [Gemmatimonadales bacterium]|nr:PTS sugar transporter subunit IIC [Gemmatimonadales bacterium]
MIDFSSLLPFALVGGLLGLDVVSFPQVMVSRPIVAATIGGAMTGNAMAGLSVGVFLELVALGTLPFGASRYPEWGSASLAGGALHGLALQYGGPADGALILAALAGLLAAWAGGITMVWLRRLNAAWARRVLQELHAGDARTIIGLQLSGLSADYLRGVVLTLVVMLLAIPPIQMGMDAWPSLPAVSGAVLTTMGGIVAAGAVWKLFHAVPRSRWLFMSGLLVGFVILLVS